ncbi:MAG: PIN domain nuclease [Desulfobacterales bacterium]
MILIDTSVWIDFFNGNETRQVSLLESLISEEEDVCLSEYILTEVLQGFRNENHFLNARRQLLNFPIYGLSGPDPYVRAAQIYRACRRQGITIRKTADCIIAQTVIEHDLYLLHNDADFDKIADVCALNIYS